MLSLLTPSASSRRLSTVAVLSLLVGCTNYEFQTDAGGRVVVADLIRDLETRSADEPQFLQQTTWVPLIFYRLRRFHRTEKTLEPAMPFGGYTYAERRAAGPLGFFWSHEEVVHYDVDGAVFHRQGRGGVGHRLVAWYEHDVDTEAGAFAYRRGEILFGILKSEAQGFPGGLDRLYPEEQGLPVDLDETPPSKTAPLEPPPESGEE